MLPFRFCQGNVRERNEGCFFQPRMKECRENTVSYRRDFRQLLSLSLSRQPNRKVLNLNTKRSLGGMYRKTNGLTPNC
jgi:hypothetical protein